MRTPPPKTIPRPPGTSTFNEWVGKLIREENLVVGSRCYVCGGDPIKCKHQNILS